MRKAYVLLLIVLISAVIMGCANKTETKNISTAEKAPKVVKIGVIGPMETKYGTAMVHAVKLAADEINTNGGILNRKIVVVTADTKMDSSTGETAFKRLVDDGCNVIIGGFSSGVCLAMQNVMAKNKVLWLGDSATPRLTDNVAENYQQYKYYFRPIGTNASTFPLDMVAMLNYLNEKGVHIKRVAIIRDNALWTDDVMKVFKPLLQKNNYTIVMDEKVNRGQTDFTTLLLKAKQLNADVIVPIIAHVRGAPLVKEWARLKLGIPIAGHDLSAIDPDYWNATGGSCNGELYTADGGGVPYPINAKMTHFLEAYRNKYHTLPEAFDAYGAYDAVYLYKQAVENAAKAGEKDPFNSSILVKYLEQFNATHPFKGVRGNIAFTKNHDLLWGNKYVRNWICQWQNGKQVVLYPNVSWIKTGKLITPWK